MAYHLATSSGYFAGGLRPAQGGWWICGDVRTWHNPLHRLPLAFRHVVRLWSLSRGGMGRGWLPAGGGAGDQAHWLIGAFGILSAEDARVEAAKAPRR